MTSLEVVLIQKNSLPPLFYVVAFSCPFLARASLVADVILVVFLSYNYPLRDFFFIFYTGCMSISIEHRHDIPSSFFFFGRLFKHVCSPNCAFFPGKLWCGLQLWTSNIKKKEKKKLVMQTSSANAFSHGRTLRPGGFSGAFFKSSSLDDNGFWSRGEMPSSAPLELFFWQMCMSVSTCLCVTYSRA